MIALVIPNFYPVLAQVSPADEPINMTVLILLSLTSLALLPFFLMMATSFVKIVVVFSLIRSALGTQTIPPNPVINGLALILTIYIMMPVGIKIYDKIESVIRPPVAEESVFSRASVESLGRAIEAGKEPMRDFLVRHASTKDRSLFYNLAKKLAGKEVAKKIGDKDFAIIIPSFVVTELTEAFQIGFIIFLPFLIMDIVISNILLSLGMFMVSPVTISLPFKLLLFVLVDGWYLITKGLVTGYI